MIPTTTVKMIEVQDWDALVEETYGKPYSFQQQDDCKSRGTETITVPAEEDDYENDSLPEVVNHNDMGVSFEAWLRRDPKQPLSNEEELRKDQWAIDMWWHRNFYPHVSMIINDLYKKGLLEAGEYTINIDW